MQTGGAHMQKLVIVASAGKSPETSPDHP